ncbi:MAG: tape measure protein [Chlorobium sp.]|nr:tape measure protein [Chlorobium sp.]
MAASSSKIEIILTAIDQSVSKTFGQVNKAMNASEAATHRYGKAMDALKAPVNAVASALTGMIAALGTGILAKSLWDAGVSASQLNVAFKSIAGTSSLAAKELAFVRAEADRIGQSFPEMANAYKGISAAAKGTNIEGEATHRIFSAIAESASALGLSGAAAEGALLAISQMISKGKVSAEELRGQLGERLPGAFGMFAEAMGVSTAELDGMLQRGEVGIDTLSRFADVLHNRYGKAAEEAASGPMGALNRLSTAWYDFKVALSQSGFLDQAAGYMNNLAAALKDPETRAAISEWASKLFSLIDTVVKLAWEWKGFIAALAGTVLAASVVATLTTAIQGLSAAVAVLSASSLGTWAASTIAAIRSVDLAAMTLKTTMGAVSGVLLALGVGWEAGKLLGQFDFIQKWMVDMIHTANQVGLAAKKMWAQLTGTDADVAAVDNKIAADRQVYNEMISDIRAGKGAGERNAQPGLKQEKPPASQPEQGSPSTPDTAKNNINWYRTPDFLDQLDEAVLTPDELADRKKRWSERETQEKQLTSEKNELLDKVAAEKSAEDEKRAKIREADAKRKADQQGGGQEQMSVTTHTRTTRPATFDETNAYERDTADATEKEKQAAEKKRTAGESFDSALKRTMTPAPKKKKVRSGSSDQIFTKKEIEAQTKIADAIKVITDESDSYRLKALKDQTAAAKDAADKQAAAQKEGVGKMQSVFTAYAERVKKIQDDIAGREKSLADELNERDPHATEEMKWRRKAKAAKDYEKAAKEALAAGRLDEALSLSDQAKQAYSGLSQSPNTKIKDQASRTSYAGLKSSGELGIAINKLLSGQAFTTAKADLSGIKGLDGLGALVMADLSGKMSALNSRQGSPGKGQEPTQIHEIRLGKARLQGSPDDVEEFLRQIKQAGLSAA